MASITVKDVLSLPAMRGARVFAGEAGLSRRVRSVNVMEVPDVEAFVRSGDLLLTTAYPIHHDPALLNQLVRVFVQRGLAALAIKRGRYLDQFPAGLAELCEELSFPLIVLRDDQPFDEILGEVMAVVLADYGAEPSRADAIRERLTAVALSGGGLDEITVTLAEAIDATVAITNLDGEMIAATEEVDDEAPVKESFTIPMAGSVVGRMLVHSGASLTLAQRRLIQQACFAVGLFVAQTQATAEVNRRLRTLALEELVSGSASNQGHLAILYDWQLPKLQQVCIAGPAAHEPDDTSKTIWGASSLSWRRGDQIVTIFSPDDVPNVRGALDRWLSLLKEASPAVVAVVGQRVSDSDALVHAHSTAVEAWEIASKTGRSAACYEDLHMELLLQSLDRQAAARFIETQLGPVIAYDRDSGGDLTATLRVILGSTNRVEAASRLYIHYNTLKYRVEQIRKLLGEDWETPERRTALVLALELHQLRDTVQPD